MRFFNSVKALYSAVGILLIAFVLGYYLDVQNEAMNARHLEISTSLEKMIRLEQELTSMLSLAVVEHNELRVTRYETVRQDVETSIKKVIDFTKDHGLAQEVAALTDGEKKIRDIEEIVLQRMRSDRWKEARGILFGDEYLSAKKTYEIDSETIPGIVQGEIEAIEKRFDRVKSAALYARIGVLCLLVWTGFMFSRRTRADLAEQMRLRTEISAAKDELEERVRERTNELVSTLQKINVSEGALRQAGQEQVAIFESLTLGIAFVKDRIILRGNTRLGELFGRPLDEMVGQTTRIWYKNEEEYLGIGASVYEDLKRQAIHQREQQLPRKDGSLFWCRFSVRAVDAQDISHGIVCTLEDITERKAATEAMRQSEGALRQAGQEQVAIFESLLLGIAFVKDRIILRGNAKLGELFGRPLAEMIGQTTRIWYKNDEEYLGIGASTYEDLKRQAIHQREQELPRKDGSLFWCLFRVRALDAQDISQGIVCTLEDITERKQAERELKERMEELERFMRLTINREKQMIRLKKEINLLVEEAGKEQKYKIVA
jgi:PAS domain S-box-containing protein